MASQIINSSSLQNYTRNESQISHSISNDPSTTRNIMGFSQAESNLETPRTLHERDRSTNVKTPTRVNISGSTSKLSF